MAYYDESGQITIDDAAAFADIEKLRSSIEILSAAKKALESFAGQASEGKGQTAVAMIAKSREMISRLTKMIAQMEDTISLINRVVAHYKAIDQSIRDSINSMG